MVLAQVDRRADDPGLFVLRRGKGLGLLEQLEKDRLADILGVVGALEVGVAQAEDQVGLGVHQPFGLPAVQCDGHVSHILCH